MSDIVVKEVKTAKQRYDFLNFPLNLYRDNPFFVPPLYSDERKIFSRNHAYSDTCKTVCFNAYRGGAIQGRISGIIQTAANEKNNEKRVRFTRFDAVNDQEVADALFEAVEKWALANGMDTVVGPLGYSDLEREGLLIDGFDELSTFEEQYNSAYYARLIEKCGYAKEVDWVESRIKLRGGKPDEKILKLEEYMLKRYNLRFGEAKNTNDFLRKYKDGFFELLDTAYADIYGTVPFTEKMKKMMIDNFRLIIDLRFVSVILDENGKVVALGICFPSIAKAVQRSGGRLTPLTIARIFKAVKKPEIIDFGLVGVAPEYMRLGLGTAMVAEIMKMLDDPTIDHAETNLNLESNTAIRLLWNHFDAVEHKKRRCYVKKLTN